MSMETEVINNELYLAINNPQTLSHQQDSLTT